MEAAAVFTGNFHIRMDGKSTPDMQIAIGFRWKPGADLPAEYSRLHVFSNQLIHIILRQSRSIIVRHSNLLLFMGGTPPYLDTTKKNLTSKTVSLGDEILAVPPQVH